MGYPGADARLLTEGWRNDPIEAGVDPNGDGNAFSFYYWSRLDIHLASGAAWDCEDLRDGCPGMVTDDGYPGSYSYLALDTSPDAVTGPGAGLRGGGANTLTACVPPAAIARAFRSRRMPRSLRAAGLSGVSASALSVRPCRSRAGRAAPRSPRRHRSRTA